MKERRVTKTKLIFGFLVVLYASITCTYPADTISANQIVRYNGTIVSSEETFELGFFRPGKSMNYYVGIWYKKILSQTVVWVLNPNTPFVDTSCELTLTLQGILIIRNTTTGNVIWSLANSSTTSMKNPTAQLLDTGNFIIYEEGAIINQENPTWQSFDFPQHTLLPGMKLGWNLVTGKERHLTSWKSDDDPASGNFTYAIDIRGYPQPFIKKGQEIIFRAGPWDGLRFTGTPKMRQNLFYNYTFVLNQTETYYQYMLVNSSNFTRLVLQPTGILDCLFWMDNKQDWEIYYNQQNDLCDKFSECGPFMSCNIEKSPFCECLKGFEPISPYQGITTDWSKGCRHTIHLECNPGEGFNKYSNLKLPDTRESMYYETMSYKECERTCKINCSCTAFANLNFSGTGNGCLLWFGNLTDIRTFAEDGRNTLYIRFSASELDSIDKRKSSTSRKRVQVIVPVALVVLVILVSICLFYRCKGKKQQQQGTAENDKGRSDDQELELPLFGLSTILRATHNFSNENKLGEGGYGPVYKGVLQNGLAIAVKRLAKTSTQGLDEFKSEVILISKLQHRNLVKLLGCCIEGGEKMLIYEYMPNKGLNLFIDDKTQSHVLDWPARYHIMNGIARGLLYLHQDSRLRIIHRDLKVSNILLDTDMNPKISDFGMAKTMKGNQTEANTNRVVGTFGYMAPEYAEDGIFSIKSDVYSFGVLMLEIVCGVKNRDFVHDEHPNNLIGHAWQLHNEGRSLQLVAKCLIESINISQVQRSIHVGLLCVQGHPEDRPTMTSVIMMLGSESPLPAPKEPGFYIDKAKQEIAQFSSSYGTTSNN